MFCLVLILQAAGIFFEMKNDEPALCSEWRWRTRNLIPSEHNLSLYYVKFKFKKNLKVGRICLEIKERSVSHFRIKVAALEISFISIESTWPASKVNCENQNALL